MEPIISTADFRDAEAILELQFLCCQSEAELYDDYEIPPLTQSLESLLSELETHRILSAKLGDEVVGSVRGVLEDGACHIGRLVVYPRIRGRG